MASAKTFTPDNPTVDMLTGQAHASQAAQEGEFNFIRQMIDLRRQKGLSQRQLAELVGTHQPSISRLEAGQIGSLSFLQKVANALDASVEIRFVPRQAAPARGARPRKSIR